MYCYIYQCSLFVWIFGIFWEGDEKLDIDFYSNLQIRNWVSPERQEYGQFLPKLRGRETQLTTYWINSIQLKMFVVAFERIYSNRAEWTGKATPFNWKSVLWKHMCAVPLILITYNFGIALILTFLFILAAWT